MDTDLTWNYLNQYHVIPTVEILKCLLDLGVDINTNIYDYTLLMHAVKNGDYYDTVELLLEKGADINIVTGAGFSALMMAIVFCKNYNNDNIIKLLINKGANLDLTDISDNTALMYAINHYGQPIVI